MSTVLRSDPEGGVTVDKKSVYYSLGSAHWQNLVGWKPEKTFTYSPPSQQNGNVETATLNMGKFGSDPTFYSAKLRLNVALGFGQYEQSIKVGMGKGICTAYYLSEKDKDQNQEIDFEFAGNCNNPKNEHQCGTQCAWTNVWWGGNQHPNMTPLWLGTPPEPRPDTTTSVYRYMIDWEPETVTWSVDLTGTGNSYVAIRTQAMTKIGRYVESLCYVFISFWSTFSPDGSQFDGKDHQAFLFQPLKFTPSSKNGLVTLA